MRRASRRLGQRFRGALGGGRGALYWNIRKRQGCKSLILLDPNRHDLSGGRHNQSEKRQKSLARLSDICQCVV
jgi:hypothetical protein